MARESEKAHRMGLRIAAAGSVLFTVAAMIAVALAAGRWLSDGRLSYTAIGFAFVEAAAAITLGMVYALLSSGRDEHDDQQDGSARH